MLGSINTLQTYGATRSDTVRSHEASTPNALRPSRSSIETGRTSTATPSPDSHNVSTMSREKDKARGNETDSSIPYILPRLHLPGHRSRHSHDQGHDGHRRHLHRHRHTRSDIPSSLRAETASPESADGSSTVNESEIPTTADTYWNHSTADSLNQISSRVSGQSMLNRISTNLTTYKNHPRHHHHHQQQQHHHHHHQYSASDHIRRLPPATHRRTTSETVASHRDQFSPTTGLSQTEIERLLARAARTKNEADANLTDSHVQHLTMQLATSNLELHTTLTSTTRTASELMRRLDEAHESLQVTAGSLFDTISSFQDLCQHSGELVTNFERKARELDLTTRTQLARQETALFDERAAKIEGLDERARVANERAETLSRRLENCRIIVANFRQREETKRRAWRGVLIGSLWGCICVVAGVVLGLSVWYWRSYAAVVRYDLEGIVGMGLSAAGGVEQSALKVQLREAVQREYDRTHNLTEDAAGSVPVEIRDILADIARRHSGNINSNSDANVDTKDHGSIIVNPSARSKPLSNVGQSQHEDTPATYPPRSQQTQEEQSDPSRIDRAFARLEL